jgi:biopolymer transport protein ExbB
MNYLELFLRGGVVMWPILFCSLLAVVIIIERYLVLRRARIDPKQLMLKIRTALSRNDVIGAVNVCSQVNAPISRILKKGIVKYHDGHAAMKESIENAGKEEIFYLEKRLGLLANIAGIAPMLGFLGTVTGMIAAFQVIERMGGAVNPSNLAGGIWEAMLTTAFGLIVGIPTLGFYNHFVGRVTKFVFEIEKNVEEFLDLVKSGDHGAEEQVHTKKSKSIRTNFTDDDDYFEPKQ